MEFYMSLLGFVEILREALQLFSKNGKLMASIALLSVLLNSLCYLCSIFTIKPWIKDLFIDLATINPRSPEFFNIKQDFGILIAIQLIYILVNSISSFFLTTATILASAITHDEKAITFKSLLLRAARLWKRPFVTCFYTNLLALGYTVLVLALLLPLLFIIESPAAKFAVMVITVVASIFLAFLSVVWTLALVVSVLEETGGIEAIGKASQIVKGKKIQGFLLNLLFAVLISSIMAIQKKGVPLMPDLAIQTIIGLFIIDFVGLISMFLSMTYTILYFHCKKNHGEEVELQGDEDLYIKIPTAPLIGENAV